MATTHLKDLAVVVDVYQDNQGNEKKRWKTVGKLLRNQNGDFIVMDRTFNPAGAHGSGDVFVSLFDPKPKQNNQQSGGYGDPARQAPAGGNPNAGRDLGDEIPFICETRA